eukprot:TRINITY_DN1354_c0_g3_i1.p1 TRINITY_DN1354_c0_g3~~TRINITY_DN1354_c0_g3_i1.p1  ORF type:complete len:193 (+),score=38.97 TRINITY_DN1354_c0_g3_i1:499-1077(+)
MATTWPPPIPLKRGNTTSTVYQWSGTASRCGTLNSGGIKVAYLFYEFGINRLDPSSTPLSVMCLPGEGASDIYSVVAADAGALVQQALDQLGMSVREQTDMVTYWLPKMLEGDPNSLQIQFLFERFESQVPLVFSPRPAHSLRLFMLFKRIYDKAVPSKPISAIDLNLEGRKKLPPSGTGSVLVEWGGADLT